MTLEAAAVDAQLDASLSQVALLASSCQAVIEAEIKPVQSSWWPVLDQELGQAEELVAGWRRDGTIGFGSDVLTATSRCASSFLAARAPIEVLFAALAQHFEPAEKAQLVARFRELEAPVTEMISLIDSYRTKLAEFQGAMLGVEVEMGKTIAGAQAEEAEIKEQIVAINSRIESLEAQVKVDREAISAARAEESTGILETIFGALLAPLTGGASLILAGIGVASIAGADKAMEGLESEISGFQADIVSDQGEISDDQRIVATLEALTLSAKLVLGDIKSVDQALGDLRVKWTGFELELSSVITKLERAASKSELPAIELWYTAACGEWALIAGHVTALSSLQTRKRTVRIG